MNHITKISQMFSSYGFIVKSVTEEIAHNCDPGIGLSIIAIKGPQWSGVQPESIMTNYAYNYKDEGYINGEEYDEILESHEIPDENDNDGVINRIPSENTSN